ncbi:hypothetical protein [Natrarchaeobaculum sulfurireducens]|uniref:Uncharacterized protein n=1 Tax=Natrarchaeobaculum sulfurireducens TaxID=2044521 RepID=A0A346PJA9_9EURY|nr:hypothetical protein [Natrarchaeobaculum sulfurireducens]AXR79604.1 hypothetical protein AArc1_3303 [Natrarchaeobaculum sulfurireducens]
MCNSLQLLLEPVQQTDHLESTDRMRVVTEAVLEILRDAAQRRGRSRRDPSGGLEHCPRTSR